MLKILNNLERSVFFNEMKLLFLYIFFCNFRNSYKFMYYKYGRLKTNIVKNKRNVYLHSSFTTE